MAAAVKRIIGSRVAADGSAIRIVRSRPAPAPTVPPQYLTVAGYQAIATAQNASIEALSDNVASLTEILGKVIDLLQKKAG
jgi:hypothetical protein